jgi:hypothetical protein
VAWPCKMRYMNFTFMLLRMPISRRRCDTCINHTNTKHISTGSCPRIKSEEKEKNRIPICIVLFLLNLHSPSFSGYPLYGSSRFENCGFPGVREPFGRILPHPSLISQICLLRRCRKWLLRIPAEFRSVPRVLISNMGPLKSRYR